MPCREYDPDTCTQLTHAPGPTAYGAPDPYLGGRGPQRHGQGPPAGRLPVPHRLGGAAAVGGLRRLARALRVAGGARRRLPVHHRLPLRVGGHGAAAQVHGLVAGGHTPGRQYRGPGRPVLRAPPPPRVQARGLERAGDYAPRLHPGPHRPPAVPLRLPGAPGARRLDTGPGGPRGGLRLGHGGGPGAAGPHAPPAPGLRRARVVGALQDHGHRPGQGLRPRPLQRPQVGLLPAVLPGRLRGPGSGGGLPTLGPAAPRARLGPAGTGPAAGGRRGLPGLLRHPRRPPDLLLPRRQGGGLLRGHHGGGPGGGRPPGAPLLRGGGHPGLAGGVPRLRLDPGGHLSGGGGGPGLQGGGPERPAHG